MNRRTTYGRKGGEGPTAGKTAETIVSACGRYRKRVFYGQRFLVIHLDGPKPLVTSAHSAEEARARCEAARLRFCRSGPSSAEATATHFWCRAELAGK